MTRVERERLSEIMGYLWAKSDNDALCAGYAEAIGDLLAEDEKRGLVDNNPYVVTIPLSKDEVDKHDE